MNPILNVQSIQAVLMNYHLLANMIHHLLLILMSDDENTNDLISLKGSDDELDVDSCIFEPSITVYWAYCAIMEFKRACWLPFTTIAMLLNLLNLL